ncbi:MAG: hypothetical protein N2260_01810 [Syntrophobacterales bacterium]|nr:hypothetical protein [Syntrophobacterales bacterium]
MRFRDVLVICLLSTSYCLAGEDLVVKTGFDIFSNKWLQTFSEKGCSNLQRTCVVQDPEKPKTVIMQYQEVAEVISKEVKSTASKATPYIGILKYVVFVYESEGASVAEAKKGPFHKKREITMTEIFRYSNGKWVSN